MNVIKNEINCIIIDDEIEACDRLENLLIKIDRLKVVGKETNADKGIKKVVELLPELVFVDIEMPKKNGFEIVNEIKDQKAYPIFIFVTAYEQYAIKAIRSAAFDYLLKPVDIDELKKTIERYIRSQKEKQRVLLPEKLKAKYSLTDREIEVIKLLIEGKSSKEIGEILFISKHTIDTHRRNILEKTGTKSTNELQFLFEKHL